MTGPQVLHGSGSSFCMLLSHLYHLQCQYIEQHVTLPETNVAPENGWLEYYFPIGEANDQSTTENSWLEAPLETNMAGWKMDLSN